MLVFDFLITPLQFGVCGLTMPNLDCKNRNCCLPRAFVNIFVGWYFERIYLVTISPDKRRSQMKWQSISIRLVRPWKIGFFTVCNATWLSQEVCMGSFTNNLREVRKDRSWIILIVVAATPEYSGFAENLDTVVCLLVFQEMSDPPSVTKYHVIEHLVMGHALQCKS